MIQIIIAYLMDGPKDFPNTKFLSLLLLLLTSSKITITRENIRRKTKYFCGNQDTGMCMKYFGIDELCSHKSIHTHRNSMNQLKTILSAGWACSLRRLQASLMLHNNYVVLLLALYIY